MLTALLTFTVAAGLLVLLPGPTRSSSCATCCAMAGAVRC